MIRQRPPSNSRIADLESVFEACETRLVLSAQALTEVLLETCSPQSSAEPFSAEPISAEPSPVESWSIEPQISEAHAATGLDNVAEQFGLTGAGQTVAIIDSGITWDHVALGQGYGPGYRVVGGWDFAEDDDQPYDDGPSGFHGTHISGVIGSDYEGNLGVAPGVDLVSLRVFNDVGEGQLEWVENALRWVHENQHSFESPITTVNISIGTLWHGEDVPEWGTLEDELQQLYESGIVVTASAGNSFADNPTEGLSYPATSQYVLPVGSVDEDGLLSDFSQRGDRILAAPGSNITSSVPDHILGRDGQINDFSAASGTSMASPYVAGASVLVRQAMEMSGWTNVNAEVITDHLHATADSIFDSVTGKAYDRLNLENAIASLLPSDSVGDNFATGSAVSLVSDVQIETWLNSTTDRDLFVFTAMADGTLTLDPDSEWIRNLDWSLQTVSESLPPVTAASNSLDSRQFELIAGQQYGLSIQSTGEIGPLRFAVDFVAETSDGDSGQGSLGGSGANGSVSVVDLGEVGYQQFETQAGAYSVTAEHSGFMTLVWENSEAGRDDTGRGDTARGDTARGDIELLNPQSFSTVDMFDGELRLDVEVVAGQRVDFVLPGSEADNGLLTIVNLVQHVGSQVAVSGTLGQDAFEVDLSSGVDIAIGGVHYSFDQANVEQLSLDGYGNRDTLSVVGSAGIDRVNLRPGDVSIENSQISIQADGIEVVTFESGGGTDRVYLYDSDADDVLRAYPRSAELVGASYEFEVIDVERIFIHATGAGNDVAYLYDSDGDDELSTRPQFTSLKGDSFFNYVRGFERVYAYANSGGYDSAQLYDSELDDRFVTSGASASVVGPGFASYTRNFEEVKATASAGGTDVAMLYGADSDVQWRSGSDFVDFRQANWTREARGFESVETYVDRQPIAVSPLVASSHFASLDEDSVPSTSEQRSESEEPNPNGHSITESSNVDSKALPLNAVTLDEESKDRLHLPEELLLTDADLARQALDAAFRHFEEANS